MIGAGRLKDRVTLLRPSFTFDGLQNVPGFAEAGTTWAEVFFVSDAEKYIAGQVEVSALIRVTMRKREIGHDWRVRHKGQDYVVTGIKPALKDNGCIEVSCGGLSDG